MTAQQFYIKLQAIKNKMSIREIYVRYAGANDDRTDQSRWISADSIWLVTKLRIYDLEEAFLEFEPRTINVESIIDGIDTGNDESIIELWWD